MLIDELMNASGVKFGTSGARGRVEDMRDEVCYAYTVAFLRHLYDCGELETGAAVALAGDLRASTPRIMQANAAAIVDCGHQVINCGFLPSPALACYGIQQGIASIMVTGSHIPDDRNGIKYNKPTGEILKPDEQGIRAQRVQVPAGRFDAEGRLAGSGGDLPKVSTAAFESYQQRYLQAFPENCLRGLRIGLYEHSSVASPALAAVLTSLGADLVRLGYSKVFVPVDTEAIRAEDVRLAHQWSDEHNLDALVSTDGDGDRPLLSDEQGNWLRGDVVGILCARFLDADSVVTPVSSNTALEKSGWFPRTLRTRIGSPYVIAGMQAEKVNGASRIVGYEANGGFLVGTVLDLEGRSLAALPTRDTLIVILSILTQAKQQRKTISALQKELPCRYTASNRLREFPTELSSVIISRFYSGAFDQDKTAIEEVFAADFGTVSALDNTDGLRITFADESIVHLRPSGNAPEFRCYNEASTEQRAESMNRRCMDIMESWRETVS